MITQGEMPIETAANPPLPSIINLLHRNNYAENAAVATWHLGKPPKVSHSVGASSIEEWLVTQGALRHEETGRAAPARRAALRRPEQWVISLRARERRPTRQGQQDSKVRRSQ